MCDELTGLYNRRAFFAEANAAIAQLKNNFQSIAILMLDIDHFKQINDQYGHAQGDEEVLMVIAETCNAIVQHTGFIGRLGGEEFAATLMNVSQMQALQVADNLRHSIAKTVFVGMETANPVTISIGMVMVTESTATLDASLKLADQTLYCAKTSGRNRIEQAILT
ncbi:MAG: GGDEF domain-containing protein [Limnothrix sp.]